MGGEEGGGKYGVWYMADHSLLLLLFVPSSNLRGWFFSTLLTVNQGAEDCAGHALKEGK